MINFLFLPSFTIRILKPKPIHHTQNREKSKNYALSSTGKNYHTNLLSLLSSWPFLDHLTSPAASSNSHNNVTVSFSVACWCLRTFTNLYGYSTREKRIIKNSFSLCIYLSIDYWSIINDVPTIFTFVDVLSSCFSMRQ